MAGGLTISTLNDSSGVLASKNGMTGIPKAWVNFSAASGTVNGSFNVSSVTRNTTGQYSVNLTTAMPNTNYAANVSHGYNGTTGYDWCIYQVRTNLSSTSVVYLYVAQFNAAAFTDPTYVYCSVFSS